MEEITAYSKPITFWKFLLIILLLLSGIVLISDAITPGGMESDHLLYHIIIKLGIIICTSMIIYPYLVTYSITIQQYILNQQLYHTILRANQAINKCETVLELYNNISELLVVDNGRIQSVQISSCNSNCSEIINLACRGTIGSSMLDSGKNVLLTICSKFISTPNLEYVVHSLVDEEHDCTLLIIPISELNVDDKIFLFVYSNEKNLLQDKKLLDLLKEMCQHVEFAARMYAVKEQQKQAAMQFEEILNTTVDGFVKLSSAGKIISENDQLCNILHLSKDKLVGRNIKDINPTFSLIQSSQTKTKGIYETEFIGHNDVPIWVEVSWSKLEQGEYVLFVRDITERKQTETELRQALEHVEYLAFHDSLTGLPNRTLLYDRLLNKVLSLPRTHTQLAVMVLDLDNFKHVNDSLGHAAGDFILQTISHRLADVIRKGDTLARMGGDEFVLVLSDLLTGANGHLQADTVARKIIQAVRTPVIMNDQTIHLSVSIGITLCGSQCGDNIHVILSQADQAMYEAKQSGRGCYRFFEDLISIGLDHVSVHSGLYEALEQNNLIVYYQPLYHVDTNKIIGAEALLRWRYHDKVIMPDVFIPVAEETDLITQLDDYVLDIACKDCKKWHDAGNPLSVTVNMSARHFQTSTVVEKIQNVLNKYSLLSSALEIEITETVILRDDKKVQQTLQQLRQLGISISIDDFGTGYSSLGYMRKFPIDVIKIDKSFITDLLSDNAAAMLVTAIIQMAKSMGMKTIAEGVETHEQAILLKQLQCDTLQGFYIAPPLTHEEFFSMYVTC